MPPETSQTDSWFHQYINAYPRMDDQQYDNGTLDGLEPEHQTNRIVQNQPQEAMS